MSQYKHWEWDAAEVKRFVSLDKQTLTTTPIKIVRQPVTGFPIDFFTTQDITHASGATLTRFNVKQGEYLEMGDVNADPIMYILVDGDTYKIDPENIVIYAINEPLCFRCGIHHEKSAFVRSGSVKDKSPILSEICSNCYRKLVNKMQEFGSKARKSGGKSPLKVSQWLNKLKDSEGKCTYCNQHVGFDNLIVEHMNPLSLGGDNSIENVTPACLSCNSSKGGRTVADWNRHEEAHQLLRCLQIHLGLSKFETTNLAIRKLAESYGLCGSGE